jgi:hypothetical protein
MKIGVRKVQGPQVFQNLPPVGLHFAMMWLMLCVLKEYPLQTATWLVMSITIAETTKIIMGLPLSIGVGCAGHAGGR